MNDEMFLFESQIIFRSLKPDQIWYQPCLSVLPDR